MTGKIVEKLVEVSENLDLVSSFFQPGKIEEYKYAYCLFIQREEAGPMLISGYLTSSLDENQCLGELDAFSVFLDLAHPRSFMDFLFLVDLYRLREIHSDHSPIELLDRLDIKFPYVPIVEELLKDSRGLLLWHHQIECLFRAFFDDAVMVTQLRKNINKSSAEAHELTATLKFGKTPLSEIINQRMPLGHTVHPNIKGAQALFRLAR